MSLAAGQTLTHYEILGPLGAGGMGEVYRARDTRLEREVAIKVLPEELADDEERLRRFEREAKTLASLNHTNVAGIHGVDQVDDVCFLALELVPGEDLSERLERGPLPVAEAIDVCRQIAEGLEAAHEAGVVHRDLKPANVRVTPEGVVKLLDFGLAKPLGPRARSEGTSSAESDSFLMTEEGLVLGTPTYMSPEQARGKLVDRRTDIWAFGCVLYECLTGRRAFGGETFSDVVASIVQGDVDWSARPAATPAHVRRLLRRCFDKDARTRLRDVGEARVALASEPEAAEVRTSSGGRFVPGLVAGAVVGALVASVAWGLARFGSQGSSTGAPPAAGNPYYLAIERPGDFPEVSPDGKWLLFDDDEGLWVRDLGQPEAELVLASDERIQAGCWSPDGQSVAFFRGGRLETLALGSAQSEPLCAVSDGVGEVVWGEGGSFLVEISGSIESDGVFLLAPGSSELERLEWLDRPDQITPDRLWPTFLPGGQEFLVTTRESDGTWIRVASLEDESLKPLVRATTRSEYVAPGWLAWLDVDRLLVQAFDPETHEVSGRPYELVRGVYGFESRGFAAFTFSDEGTLLYRVPDGKSELEWVARGGRSLGSIAEPDHYGSVRLDPRGERLAYTLENSETGSLDLWVRELARGTSTRITSHERWVSKPRWSPDGTRLAFLADWKGPPHVYLVDLDAREPVEIVPYDGTSHTLSDWTADGAVMYGKRTAGSIHLWMVEVEDLERRALVESPFRHVGATVSRDGEWIAYASDETGTLEIYVATYPAFRDRTRVSTDGGTQARWNEDGTEIYYGTPEGVFAASFDAEGPTIGPPELVVPDWGDNLIEYDVAPDGQRFVVRRSDHADRVPPDRLITDWPRLLER